MGSGVSSNGKAANMVVVGSENSSAQIVRSDSRKVAKRNSISPDMKPRRPSEPMVIHRDSVWNNFIDNPGLLDRLDNRRNSEYIPPFDPFGSSNSIATDWRNFESSPKDKHKHSPNMLISDSPDNNHNKKQSRGSKQNLYIKNMNDTRQSPRASPRTRKSRTVPFMTSSNSFMTSSNSFMTSSASPPQVTRTPVPTPRKSKMGASATSKLRRNQTFHSVPGHEHPYSIKMSHARDTARADGPETPVIMDQDLNDNDVQFILRENKKMAKKGSFGK